MVGLTIALGRDVNAQLSSPRPSSSPYRLDVNGEAFYRVLEEATAELMVEVEGRFGSLLDEHEAQLLSAGREVPRSRGEYAVELLTFGVLLSEYGALAAATPRELVSQMETLWHVRSTNPALKAAADRQRGELFAELLWGESAKALLAAAVRPSFAVFLRWLSATGEFVQEAKRMATWRHAQASDVEQDLTADLEALADWFRGWASICLGRFTTGVAAYRQSVLAARAPREDLLLVTRNEVLYHLNLLGAQVMNRGFEQGYAARSRKVVLLPGCMRAPEKDCRARQDGLDIRCTHCSSRCQISAITQLGDTHGFEVYVVPHASSFTAWLEHWRGDGSTALVAAACPLHLLAGGYEMRELGIDAQCVFLDYSGCRRHWDPQGTPTRVEPSRLLRVVQGNGACGPRTPKGVIGPASNAVGTDIWQS